MSRPQCNSIHPKQVTVRCGQPLGHPGQCHNEAHAARLRPWNYNPPMVPSAEVLNAAAEAVRLRCAEKAYYAYSEALFRAGNFAYCPWRDVPPVVRAAWLSAANAMLTMEI